MHMRIYSTSDSAIFESSWEHKVVRSSIHSICICLCFLGYVWIVRWREFTRINYLIEKIQKFFGYHSITFSHWKIEFIRKISIKYLYKHCFSRAMGCIVQINRTPSHPPREIQFANVNGIIGKQFWFFFHHLFEIK